MPPKKYPMSSKQVRSSALYEYRQQREGVLVAEMSLETARREYLLVSGWSTAYILDTVLWTKRIDKYDVLCPAEVAAKMQITLDKREEEKERK